MKEIIASVTKKINKYCAWAGPQLYVDIDLQDYKSDINVLSQIFCDEDEMKSYFKTYFPDCKVKYIERGV